MKWFTYYLIIVNVLGFMLYLIDKIKAKKHVRRISERTLFIVSFIGGVLGTIMGMFVFRHKTRKGYFMLCNVSALILWGYIIWCLYK